MTTEEALDEIKEVIARLITYVNFIEGLGESKRDLSIEEIERFKKEYGEDCIAVMGEYKICKIITKKEPSNF